VIKKEFNCAKCGDFESGLAICPQCGERSLRVFRTAPGISLGRSRSIDRVLEGEFARRNISNYTNTGGRPVVNYGSGEYNGIKAGWGKSHLSTVQQQYAPLMPPGVQLTPPVLPTGHNPAIPHVDTTVPNPRPGWGGAVPTERMDLTPNE
jgi:hypothetical protein